MPRGLSPFLLLIVGAFVRAEPPTFPDENEDRVRQLETLAELQKQGRWPEVLRELHTLLGAAGDELVALDKHNSVRLRWLCQARLAQLPAEQFREHLRRVEPAARKAFEEGRRLRDPRPLRRAVEDGFCSDSAAVALELLGDLAFSQAEWDEAEYWWRLLAPLPDAPTPLAGLRHPRANEVEARIQARQLLVRWFRDGQSRADAWRAEVAAYQKRHPRARGHLAGIDEGLFWKTLLDVAARDQAPAPPADWTTFAGSPSRNHVVRGEPLNPLPFKGATWQVLLSEEVKAREPSSVLQRAANLTRSTLFCPLILGRRVFVADSRYVTAYDMMSGKKEVFFDITRRAREFMPEGNSPAPEDWRCTLTAGDDCLLARFGPPALTLAPRAAATWIVCLGLNVDAQGNRVRWLITPGDQAVFEGVPLVNDNRVHVAVTRSDADRVVTALHCYGLQGRGVAPLRWKRDVAARNAQRETPRQQHYLLTQAGPHVVYCTHDGAVVALDAVSGQPAWSARYRQVKTTVEKQAPPHDLNPAVYAEGRVFVAPSDSAVLLCYEAATGRLLWERERVSVIHLLGVAQDRVIFSTLTPRAGLRAINVLNGSDRGGWFRSGEGEPIHSFGRGLLADEYVYWPTLDDVMVLRQLDGAIVSRLEGVAPGNLSMANSALVVTDRTKMHVHLSTPVEKPR